MTPVLALVLLTVCSLLLTGAVRRYALRRSLLDQPGSRSSHRLPTPRGGGLGLVLTSLAAVALALAAGHLQMGLALALLGGCGLVALVGWIDDHGHVSAGWRLLAHAAAAAWGLAWVGGLPAVTLPVGLVDLGWFGHGLAWVGLVWLLNLYNFMDGIDGLAGLQAVTVTGSIVVLALLFEPGLAVLLPTVVLGASVMGFLPWNFPGARLFMGDVGSGYIGLWLGLCAVSAAGQEPEWLWVWLLLLAVFLVDATWTLLRRLLQGQSPTQAHRTHGYQRAARALGSHPPVTLLVAAVNLGLLLPLAAAVLTGVLPGWLGLSLAVLALLPVVIGLGAGRESP